VLPCCIAKIGEELHVVRALQSIPDSAAKAGTGAPGRPRSDPAAHRAEMRLPRGTRTETWASSLSVLQRRQTRACSKPRDLRETSLSSRGTEVLGFVVQPVQVH